jgi:hypothetical protein
MGGVTVTAVTVPGPSMPRGNHPQTVMQLDTYVSRRSATARSLDNSLSERRFGVRGRHRNHIGAVVIERRVP